MGKVFRLDDGDAPVQERPTPAAARPAAPRSAETPGGLAQINQQLTPLMAAGIVAVLLVLVAGLWFAFGRGPAGANTPMMDTTSESTGGISPDSQHQNGMDTGTGSGRPTASNGMDTGTGR